MSCQEETKKASTTQNLSSLLDVAKEDKRFNNLAYRLTNRLNHLQSSADQSDPKTHTPSLKEMLSEFGSDSEEQKEMIGEFFTALILKQLTKKDEVEQKEGEGKQTDEKDDDQPTGGGSPAGGLDKSYEGEDKEGADEPTVDDDGKDVPAAVDQRVGRDQPDKGSHQDISLRKGDDEIANKRSTDTEQETSHSPPEKKVKLTNADDIFYT